MRIITAILTVLFTGMLLNLNAQIVNSGDQVMIKGKVIDQNTGEPLGVELEFRMENGKKFTKESDKRTGEFKQLLNAGVTYEIEFTGDNIYREIQTFTAPSNSEEGYSETTETFKIKKLAPGVVVEELDLFEPGTANITSQGRSALKKFKISMRFNRNAHFEFVVKAPSSGLAKQRMQEIKDFVSDWRRAQRRIELSIGTGSDVLQIKVSKVKDMFK